jgi:predicted nucleic acid-binding protein
MSDVRAVLRHILSHKKDVRTPRAVIEEVSEVLLRQIEILETRILELESK